MHKHQHPETNKVTTQNCINAAIIVTITVRYNMITIQYDEHAIK